MTPLRNGQTNTTLQATKAVHINMRNGLKTMVLTLLLVSRQSETMV